MVSELPQTLVGCLRKHCVHWNCRGMLTLMGARSVPARGRPFRHTRGARTGNRVSCFRRARLLEVLAMRVRRRDLFHALRHIDEVASLLHSAYMRDSDKEVEHATKDREAADVIGRGWHARRADVRRRAGNIVSLRPCNMQPPANVLGPFPLGLPVASSSTLACPGVAAFHWQSHWTRATVQRTQNNVTVVLLALSRRRMGFSFHMRVQ